MSRRESQIIIVEETKESAHDRETSLKAITLELSVVKNNIDSNIVLGNEQLANVKNELLQVHEDVSTVKEKAQDEKNILNELVKERIIKEEEYTDLLRNIEEAKNKIHFIEKDCLSTNNELQKQNKLLEIENENIVHKHTSTLATLQDKVAELNITEVNLKSNIAILCKKVEELDKEERNIGDLTNTSSQLSRDVIGNTVVIDALNNEITAKNEEIASILSNVYEVRATFVEINREKDTLDEEIRNRRRALEILENRVDYQVSKSQMDEVVSLIKRK